MDKNSGGTVTKTTVYYPAGGAMRVNGTLYYVLKDHLGSASVVTDNSGNVVGDQRYYPFGGTRLATGSMYTDKLFTGQREMAGLGIYHYGSRFYSPSINRFLSADTVVPGMANPQNLNRFSYVGNNPIRYTDPTGFCRIDAVPEDCLKADKSNAPKKPKLPGSGGGGGGGGLLGGASGGGGGGPSIDPPTTDPNLGGSQPEPLLDPTNDAGNTCDASCVEQRIKAGPDYVVASLGVPLLSFIPVVGSFIPIEFQLTRDYYNNWYFGVGIGISNPGISGGITGGYLLQPSRPGENVVESFISNNTVAANVGYIGGGGLTWGDPSLTRSPEVGDVAVEVGGFYPFQGTLEYVYGIPIYDAGNSQPWIPWLFPP